MAHPPDNGFATSPPDAIVDMIADLARQHRCQSYSSVDRPPLARPNDVLARQGYTSGKGHSPDWPAEAIRRPAAEAYGGSQLGNAPGKSQLGEANWGKAMGEGGREAGRGVSASSGARDRPGFGAGVYQ